MKMDDARTDRGEVYRILNKWLFAALQSGKTTAERDVKKVLNYFESIQKKGEENERNR